MNKPKQRKRFSGIMWLGSILAALTIAAAVFASWVLYQYTIELLTQNLRERLLSISITQAANISPDDLAVLQDEEDWQTPEWERVVSSLKRTKDANPNIVFMYIFRKKAEDPARMEFVADAESIYPYANSDEDPTNDVDSNGDGVVEPDGADYLQWPGQDYDEAVDIPEAYEAYNGPLTARELYEDVFGEVLTGYAPIRDESGNVVAILATDIKADDFLTVTRQTLFPFIVFISFLIIIIAILAFSLVRLWRRRAEEIANLASELEKVNSQQVVLIHFITHQIKGFVTKSRNIFSMLLEGDFGAVPEPMRPMLEEGFRSDTKGVTTIQEILNAANIKSGKVTYAKEPVDLKELAGAIVSDLKPNADEKSLALSYAAEGNDFTIQGDRMQLTNAIKNLVDNSIKYTPSGTVAVKLVREASKVRLTIQDTGVGITPEDMKHLFTEGGHGKESQKVNVESTGFGLYIVKNIIQAHNGRVWAESEGEGKGSRFIVELPVG